MKSLRLITAALLISTLSSCSLIGAILGLPSAILRSAGAIALTDEAPELNSEKSGLIETTETDRSKKLK